MCWFADDVFPMLMCPKPYIIELTDPVVQTIQIPQTNHVATVRDNKATHPSLTYIPNQLITSSADVGKVYSLAVIATDVFDLNCKNMDIAVDSKGRVYVADTEHLEIHQFVPEAGEGQP